MFVVRRLMITGGTIGTGRAWAGLIATGVNTAAWARISDLRLALLRPARRARGRRGRTTTCRRYHAEEQCDQDAKQRVTHNRARTQESLA